MQNIEFNEPLLQEYQYALLDCLKDPQRELNTTCRKIGERFGGKDIKARNIEEFTKQFADFLKNYLKMVKDVSVEYDQEKHVLSIDIEGCKFCPANTFFKSKNGGKAVCPLGGLVRGALKNVESKIKSFKWLDTKKPPGTIGICTTTYEVDIE